MRKTREQMDSNAARLGRLLEQTACKSILEKILDGKVEYQWSGPNAGQFLTEPFPEEDIQKGAPGSAANFMILQACGIDCDTVFNYNATGHGHCYGIDPTQKGFFQALEQFLVECKLTQLGIVDDEASPSYSVRASYVEQRRKAEKEAQKDLWRDIPVTLGKSLR